MARTLEIIFQRFVQLLLLMMLFPLASLAIAYALPRSYQTNVTLWALRRYEIIGATDTNSDLLTPADTQAAALSELLQTRTFALDVVKGTDLASTLTFVPNPLADSQRLDDALVNEISLHVQVKAVGSNLFVITYQNPNPRVAQQVVESAIRNYGLQSQSLSVTLDQNVLQNYQTQLVGAKKDLNAAAVAESQYISAHPGVKRSDLLSDPQYVALHAQTGQAEAIVQDLQTRITSVEQAIATGGTGVDSLFRVLDSPAASTRPVSRLRLFLLAGGIGLVVAIVGCALYIVISVRRDHAMYTALDLQKVTALPILMQVPHLKSRSMVLAGYDLSHLPHGK